MRAGTSKKETRAALYCFNWKNNRFALVEFVMIDPLKDLP
jgi:hypothetical protein